MPEMPGYARVADLEALRPGSTPTQLRHHTQRHVLVMPACKEGMTSESDSVRSGGEFEPTQHEFEATTKSGTVSALLTRPAHADCLLVLGHGAGAGMRHAFMEALAVRLANHRIAVFRYQFPYMEQGRRRPDFQPVLLKTVRSAIYAAAALSDGLPLFASGKSMGGRMTSLAAAKEPLSGVRGIIFFGFPLHPAQKPGIERSEHLRAVEVPMLFLQGTRDKLAPLERLDPVCRDLPQSTLHVIEGADHGFHVLKKSGRSDDDVHNELADATRTWINDRSTTIGAS